MGIHMVPVPEARPRTLIPGAAIVTRIIPQRIRNKLNPRRRVGDKDQIKHVRIGTEEAQRAQTDVVDAAGRELRGGRVRRVRVAEEVAGQVAREGVDKRFSVEGGAGVVEVGGVPEQRVLELAERVHVVGVASSVVVEVGARALFLFGSVSIHHSEMANRTSEFPNMCI